MSGKQKYKGMKTISLWKRKGKIERVKYYKYLCTMVTNDWSENEVKGKIVVHKDSFNRGIDFNMTELHFNKRLVNCYVWNHLCVDMKNNY